MTSLFANWGNPKIEDKFTMYVAKVGQTQSHARVSKVCNGLRIGDTYSRSEVPSASSKIARRRAVLALPDGRFIPGPQAASR